MGTDKLKEQELIIVELTGALKDVLSTAVILSEDYLSAFASCGDSHCIQGWEKSRWIAALAAKKKAIITIEKASGI